MPIFPLLRLRHLQLQRLIYADQLSSLCLGYGIGVTFDEVEKSTLGVKAKFDDITPDILRLACITDVICELVNSAPTKGVTPLDELMYD